MATKKKPTRKKAPIKTTVALSKTKPANKKRIAQAKKTIQKDTKKAAPKPKQKVPQKSRIKEEQMLDRWFLPARVGLFLNGVYFLIFALIAFAGLGLGFEAIEDFFVLPFEETVGTLYLLEISAAFGLIASLLYFHAAQEPRRYSWFYFLVVLFVLPGNFIANLQKMQLDLSLDFQNYLYFDTLVVSILWGINILSIYAFLKTLKRNN